MDSYQQHLACLKKIFPGFSYSTIIEQQVRRAGVGRDVRLSVIQEIVASDKDRNIPVSKSDEETLKAIFADSSIDPKDISHLMSVLAPVSNRVEVICRLLCDRLDKKNRKRPNTELPEVSSEAATSKQIKITDSSDEDEIVDIRSNEASGKGLSNLSVVIGKDRKGNHVTQITSSSTKKNSASSSSKTDPVIIPQGTNETNHNGLNENEVFPLDLQVAGRSHRGTSSQPRSVLLETAKPIDMSTKLGPRDHEDELEVITINDNLILSKQNVLSEDELAEEARDEAAVIEPEPEPTQEELPLDQTLVSRLMEVFPEACPNYIRSQCRGQVWSELAFGNIAETILSSEYPKRPRRTPSPDVELNPQEQLAMMKAVLPDADPSFLEKKVEQFGGDNEAVRQFVETAMELRNYPTMKEYLRKKQLCAQQKQYTTEFNVERFVEIFPDPVSVFEDPNRKSTMFDGMDRYYVKCFMRNKYPYIYARDVNWVVDRFSNVNVMTIVNKLDSLMFQGQVKKHKNHVVPMAEIETQNIPLLQELAYVDYKPNILTYIEVKKEQAAKERAIAKKLGLFQSCSCCFDDEVMPTNILTCTRGCTFCRDCVRRSTEVAFGSGKTDYPCLSADCQAELSLQVLQHALPPKVFSKLAQKKALAEVKAAGVEDLVMCPFCDFANIPDPEDKLFRCLNPDCMKESCRLCKEPSHVPLRCDEVEKDEAVKARTFIENKMTEALVRECWKCGAKFIKEEGCNKMTCSCGAVMCYVCRKPVADYSHFNGQGGDRLDLCPLYTENSLVNEKNVLQAAEEAKKQVDPAQLVHDPTAGLDQLFENKVRDAEMGRMSAVNLLRAFAMGIPRRMEVLLDPNMEDRDLLRLVNNTK